MSRPLRIEYPDAWYHIMNRGRRHEPVFEDKDDYAMFLALLQETIEIFHIKVSAYCLMQNHYHLLIQTPEANISRSMRHINGIYTQRFNKMHGYDGHLFRGRYKSILIDADSYLLQVMRYVHRNPINAGVTEDLNYTWSSHKAYLSDARKWNWVSRDKILEMLNRKKVLQKSVYRDFVKESDNDDFSAIYKKRKLPAILGSETFLKFITDQYFNKKRHIEVPESRLLVPEIDKIISAVCVKYKASMSDLQISKRGQINEPRNVAMYLMRNLRGDTLSAICKEFGLKKDSSAGSIVDRVKKQLIKDKDLRNSVDEIKKMIIKS
ncbi:MAG TPA: transposase [Spirochaetota bacterium]|nr:transposase [Spirochaetota bacterium]HPJ68139.1 transposase [Desulfobacteraceae bacterium]HPQ28903.1 transposase [Desulfobacteraceae bacterium]